MKKHLATLVVLLFTAFTATGSYAQSKGGPLMTKSNGFAVGLGYDYAGYGLSVRYNGISGLLATKDWGTSISGDYALVNDRISGASNLEWYAGAGGYILMLDDLYYLGGGTSAGVRGRAGVMWVPSPQVEVFTQLSPTIGFGTYLNNFFFMYSFGMRVRL